MQLARFLLICVDNAADGSPSWAVYDDDKPVKKIEWEEVAKQQASVLIWNRRHPRQQPLDTPSPRILVAGPSLLPSSPSFLGQVPLPKPSEEPHAAVAISPPVSSSLLLHHCHIKQLRVCTCPLKSLMQWQSPHHLLPWMITLRPRPMKSPMQEHISLCIHPFPIAHHHPYTTYLQQSLSPATCLHHPPPVIRLAVAQDEPGKQPQADPEP